MATETNKVTLYGVARGDKLIAGGYPTAEQAKDQHTLYSEQMTALDLDPDVRVVEYDVETIVKTGRVRAYREPTDTTTTEPDATDPEGTDTTANTQPE